LAAVDADGCALIEGDGDDVGMVGIDPDGVVVVASGSAFDGGESLASVGGAVGGGVGDVDRVFIPGIDLDAAEVVAASVDTFFRRSPAASFRRHRRSGRCRYFFLALTQAYMRSGSLGETVGPMRPMPSASPGRPLVS